RQINDAMDGRSPLTCVHPERQVGGSTGNHGHSYKRAVAWSKERPPEGEHQHVNVAPGIVEMKVLRVSDNLRSAGLVRGLKVRAVVREWLIEPGGHRELRFKPGEHHSG